MTPAEFTDEQRAETETSLNRCRRKVAELENKLDKLNDQRGDGGGFFGIIFMWNNNLCLIR